MATTFSPSILDTDINDHTMTTKDKLRLLAQEIDQSRADVDLLERLTKASTNLSDLLVRRIALTAINDAEVAAQSKAAYDARFSGLSAITVVDKTPDESVIRSSFEITYTSLAYDMYSNESLPVQKSALGFGGLPSNVLAYLIERHPSQVPSKIGCLAPNPEDAFALYFVGLQRGHMTAAHSGTHSAMLP